MKESIRIREAVKEDLQALLACEQEVITAERPFDPTIKNGKVTYYDLLGLLQNPKALVIVACDGDKIVATGYALEKPARSYLDHKAYSYLGFMFTDLNYRGQGINGVVIERLKQWSFSMGLTELRLTVYTENSSAIHAYEKVGFTSHMVEMRLRLKE